MVSIPVSSRADTIVVDPSGAGDHTTITAGIDAASTGDIVAVAAGTYTEDLDFLGKAITVQGTSGAAATFLVGSGEGPAVVFDSGETSDAELIGFDISGGDGTFDDGYLGGCISIAGSSPTLQALVLHDCTAHLGGGLLLGESGSELVDITIYENNAIIDSGDNWGYGGGLYAYDSDLVLEGLVVYDNDAERGAGLMFGDGTSEITNSTIGGNEAERAGGISYLAGTHELTSSEVDSNLAGTHSGGVWANLESNVTITDTVISGNEAPDGGGLRVTDATVSVVSCTFTDNQGPSTGGGFRVDTEGSLSISFSTFDGNEAGFGGGGLSTQDGTIDISTSRFTLNAADSSGGALYLAQSETTVTATIFDGNEADGDGGAIRLEAGSIEASTSLFVDNAANNGAGVHLFSGAVGTLQHLTMVGNAASSGGTVRVTSDSELALTDSIVAFPEDGSCLSVGDGAAWTIAYNDIFATSGPEYSGTIDDQEGLNGNQSVNPTFVAWIADGVYDGSDDLHLGSGSLCIDAADPLGSLDLDGTTPDQGAYGGEDADLWDEEPPPIGDDDDDDDDDDDANDDDDATDDDDSAPDDDDDDSAPDDDDDSAADDDDATDDDDDDAAILTPPDTEGCSCESSLTAGFGPASSVAWLVGGLALICRRRRVSSRALTRE